MVRSMLPIWRRDAINVDDHATCSALILCAPFTKGRSNQVLLVLVPSMIIYLYISMVCEPFALRTVLILA
jgi:hypothetical protein